MDEIEEEKAGDGGFDRGDEERMLMEERIERGEWMDGEEEIEGEEWMLNLEERWRWEWRWE